MEVEAPVSSSKGLNGSAYDLAHDDAVRKRRRFRCICVGVIFAVLAIGIIILVLSLVFKAKNPVTNVNSIELKDVDFSLDMARFQIRINISLDANISLKNRNKVGFKYSNSTSYVNYRGKVVGEVPIPAGKILAGKTTALNLTLTLMADRLVSDSHLYMDVISRSLPLSMNTRISGQVQILFVKFHVISYTDCNLFINVFDRNLTRDCRYKTKL